MNNETMRAVVLLVRLALSEGEGFERHRNQCRRELSALSLILERASRASAGRPLEELEATAEGRPMPDFTQLNLLLVR